MSRAYYTGCLDHAGHYFWQDKLTNKLYDRELPADMPGSWKKMWDGGLLRNGRRPDVYDGRVYAVPAKGDWTAFVWWDNSIDKRPGSNSGFYVQGFSWEKRTEAFEFAKKEWPSVVTRQRCPLVLVSRD